MFKLRRSILACKHWLMEISHVFHGAVSRKALFASCLNYNEATRLIYVCDICPLTAYKKTGNDSTNSEHSTPALLSCFELTTACSSRFGQRDSRASVLQNRPKPREVCCIFDLPKCSY